MGDIEQLIAYRTSVATERLQLQDNPSKPKGYILKALPFVITFVVAVVVVAAGLSVYRDLNDDNTPTPAVNVEDVCEQASKQYNENLSHVFDRLAREVDEGKITTRDQLGKAARSYTEAARENAFASVDALDNKSIPKKEFIGIDDDGKDFDLTDSTAQYLRRKAVGHRKASQ